LDKGLLEVASVEVAPERKPLKKPVVLKSTLAHPTRDP